MRYPKETCVPSTYNFSFLYSTKTDTISMPNFIEFMNEKQRDPRLNEILYPCYDEKRCKEIINKYEKNEENKAKSKYVY